MKKRNIAYYLRIYRKIVTQDIKSKMSYRADFFISMIGMIATNIAGALSFWLIFQNFPSVAGWNYYEMLFLYGFTLVAATPAQCMFDNNWNLRIVVYSGDFIKYCFRPVNLFFYYISEVFDLKGIWQFGFGLGLVIYSWGKLGLAVTFVRVAIFVIGVLSASLFVIALLNAASATCFWLVHSFFVLQLANTLRDYASYPITIFGPTLRTVFTFIIPIAFMAYYPSIPILREAEMNWVTWMTPVFGVLFFYLSYRFWMKGAMAYDGTGN